MELGKDVRVHVYEANDISLSEHVRTRQTISKSDLQAAPS